MKNKKKYLMYIVIAIFVVGGIVAYFLFGRTKVSEEEGMVKIEKDNIVTETTTFLLDDLSYEITKNRISKNASIKISYPIPDDVEYTDFLGEQITSVPFVVNFACVMFNASFFDLDAYQEIIEPFNEEGSESTPITENEIFAEKMQGYEIKDFSIEFIDQEDQDIIAKCSSKNKGNENIKFDVYRDYTGIGSFFGVEIGVFDTDTGR